MPGGSIRAISGSMRNDARHLLLAAMTTVGLSACAELPEADLAEPTADEVAEPELRDGAAAPTADPRARVVAKDDPEHLDVDPDLLDAIAASCTGVQYCTIGCEGGPVPPPGKPGEPVPLQPPEVEPIGPVPPAPEK